MSEVDLSGKKLLVSVPAYDSKVYVEWMLAFNNMTMLCMKHGVEVGIHFKMGSSLIPKARDEIIHNFLFDTDYDYLLCIDSDVVWKPEDPLHMLSRVDKFGVIAGMYPVKQDEPKFFADLMFLNKNVIEVEGLLRAKAVPAGFMMLTRETLMKMREEYKELNYKPSSDDINKDHAMCAMFTPMAQDGKYRGEDIAFCHRLVKMGQRLWIDPEIELIHIGSKKYDYSYKEYLNEVVAHDAPVTLVT